jgi:hypothetical protein
MRVLHNKLKKPLQKTMLQVTIQEVKWLADREIMNKLKKGVILRLVSVSNLVCKLSNAFLGVLG